MFQALGGEVPVQFHKPSYGLPLRKAPFSRFLKKSAATGLRSRRRGNFEDLSCQN